MNCSKIPRSGENRRPLESSKRNEVRVPGYDAIGIACIGRIKKFVVVGIAANEESAPRRHHFAVTHQNDGGSFAPIGRNVSVEFFAGDDVEEFVAGRRRKNDSAAFGENIEEFSGGWIAAEGCR
ncbi:MAG TPA: hypothetical protein VGV06_15115 [Methylomirabilota bacterium]|nr:hypothetical protein [Methylomirabilota bacterium]